MQNLLYTSTMEDYGEAIYYEQYCDYYEAPKSCPLHLIFIEVKILLLIETVFYWSLLYLLHGFYFLLIKSDV